MCGFRNVGRQADKLLLHFRHCRHPWRQDAHVEPEQGSALLRVLNSFTRQPRRATKLYRIESQKQESRTLSALDVGCVGSGPSGARPINCSCIFGIAAIHGGKTRTSSLHMDVRFLAVPEHAYPAAKANYSARFLTLKIKHKKRPPNWQPFLRTFRSNRLLTTTASALVYVFPAHCAEEHLVPALVAPRY